MSFQAYLDNVKAKTGKTPEDFAKLAAQKGLAKHRDSSSGIRALSISEKHFFAESKYCCQARSSRICLLNRAE
jgi:hypothetical protein